jgi:opacity protein-like surface antigen
MRLILIAVAAGFLCAQGASAQDSSDPLDTRIFKNGWWVGGGVSWSDLDADDINLSDNDFGFNLAVGYQFLNYFGLNARYRYLGEFTDTINPPNSTDVTIDGYTIGATAGYPISKRIAPVIGIGYYDFDFDANSGVNDNDSQGVYISGGIATQIGRIVIQPNLVWYDVDDYDLTTVEVNFFWKFESGN